MSQEKKERLQSTSFENKSFNLKNTGSPNLKMNNTNRTATKMIRGASRGS